LSKNTKKDSGFLKAKSLREKSEDTQSTLGKGEFKKELSTMKIKHREEIEVWLQREILSFRPQTKDENRANRILEILHTIGLYLLVLVIVLELVMQFYS